jgi:hypothetical protein
LTVPWRPLTIAAFLHWSGLVCAQEIQVYSEFRRLGADGQIIEADRAGKPREILSPAIPRNGFATFYLVVKGEPGKPYHVYLGENPEGILKTTLYRVGTGSADTLEPVKLPVSGILAESTLIFALDVWTPATAPVRRVRLEAQLNSGDRWIIYPLELRLQPAIIPLSPITFGQLAPPTAPSSDTAISALDPYLCGKTHKATESGPSLRNLIRRNASQDVALAKKLEITHGKDKVRAGIMRALGVPDAPSWCGEHKMANPEDYLRVRDFLYKLAIEAQ